MYHRKFGKRYPGFEVLEGRKPLAGLDFDPQSSVCQDDYEFLTGTGRYYSPSDLPVQVFNVPQVSDVEDTTERVTVPLNLDDYEIDAGDVVDDEQDPDQGDDDDDGFWDDNYAETDRPGRDFPTGGNPVSYGWNR